MGSIPGLERSPGEGNGNSLQYSWQKKKKKKPYGQRILAGYRPQDRKESDTTEHAILEEKNAREIQSTAN